MEVLQFLTSSLFAEFYKDAGTPVDINPMSIIGLCIVYTICMYVFESIGFRHMQFNDEKVFLQT